MAALVVHTGGIGDFILCCPTIKAMAEGGHVELLGNTERLALAVKGGLANAAHGLDNVEFQSLFTEPSKVLCNFLSRFDRVVVWMTDEDGKIREGLRRCGVSEADIYPGVPPNDWNSHASDYFLNCLDFPSRSALRLNISRSHETYDVIVHPGSGSEDKNWPIENFIQVAARLEGEGRRVTWCTGPAELDSETFQLWVGALQGDRLYEESLVELARALASAKVFIGNDAGITHLAAAVGCPTVAIFASTDPQVWAPKGSHVCAVFRGNWPDAESVIGAVQAVETGGF